MISDSGADCTEASGTAWRRACTCATVAATSMPLLVEQGSKPLRRHACRVGDSREPAGAARPSSTQSALIGLTTDSGM